MKAVIISDLPDAMFHKFKRCISHHPGQLENSRPSTFEKSFIRKLGRRLDDILSNTFNMGQSDFVITYGVRW